MELEYYVKRQEMLERCFMNAVNEETQLAIHQLLVINSDHIFRVSAKTK
jgi:hypothetical protein